MSIFRTLVESLLKSIYVEGLSIEEAYGNASDNWSNSWNEIIRRAQEKEQDKQAVRDLLKRIRKYFKENSNINIEAKQMSDSVKGWNADENSYYAYAKTTIGMDCIDPKYRNTILNGFQEDIPISVAFRVSTHDTVKDSDLDILVPDPDRFKVFGKYLKGVGGYNTQSQSGRQGAFKFYKFNDSVNEEYAKRGCEQIQEKIKQFTDPNSKQYMGKIINDFLKYYEQTGSLSTDKLKPYFEKNPDLQLWFDNLLNYISSK